MRKLDGLLLDEALEMRSQGIRFESPSNPASALKRISEKPLLERPRVIAITKELDRKLNPFPYQ